MEQQDFFLSAFLGATIYLNVGGGYNLYDKKNKKIEIFPTWFPREKERNMSFIFNERN